MFAGYLVLIVLEIIGSRVLAAALAGQPGISAILGGETVVFVSGIIAGAVTARIAPARRLSHATALAFAIVSAAVVAAALTRPPAQQPFPNWYPYAVALLAGAGAFAGGALVSGRPSEPGA